MTNRCATSVARTGRSLFRAVLTVFLTLLSPAAAYGQAATTHYRNPELSVAARVDDLLSRMTRTGSHTARRAMIRARMGVAAIILAAPLPGVAQDREIAFNSSTAGVTLTGTITAPTVTETTVLAVLVAVAGPTDRDLSLGRHKYFKRLADGLAEGGIATLRYDDRGVGGSGGSLGATDLSMRAADACEAVQALRTAFPSVDRAGLIGMSEGGGIALLVAEQCSSVSFAGLLSAPIRHGRDVMEGQMLRALAAGAIPEQRRAEIEGAALRFLSLVGAEQPAENRAEILELLSGPNGDAVLPPYAFVPRAPEARTEFVLSRWYQSQVHYDVRDAASSASIPILAIYGTLDQAISPEANAALLRQLAPEAEVVMLPGLNHLMQEANTGSPLEYMTLPESVSLDVVERIVEWLAR